MKNLLFILNFASLNIWGQLENAQWRFGIYGALDFKSATPVSLNSSRMPNSVWCGASIADSSGNLLLYTDGSKIWNRNDTIMQNGNIGAITNLSSSQAALIFHKKGRQYYLVIANKGGASKIPFPQFINYALIDMSADNGLGAVTASNQPISPPGVYMSTKLAGARHCNGTDFWLLTHEADTNVTSAGTNTLGGSRKFHAYRITRDSIYKSPVISTVGSAQFLETSDNIGTIGYGIVKFSPNGRKVACTYPNKTVEIFDFDNSTGQVTNVLQLETINSPSIIPMEFGGPYVYGVEFSPDGNRLYVTYLNAHPTICQYDLAAGSASAVIASKSIINPDTFMMGTCLNCRPKALQLAPDGKIYVAEPGLSSLGVINNPNALGSLCNYSSSAVSLGTVSIPSPTPIWAKSNYGLPGFISSHFEQKPVIPSLTGSMTCGVGSFSAPVLSSIAGYSVTSYNWNFGDSLSGVLNTSTVANSVHAFSSNGTYTVTLVLNYKCGADTLSKAVVVSGLPQFTITKTPQSKICAGETVTLNFSGASSFSINGTANSQGSALVQPGVTTVYTITGTDSNTGCHSFKAISISVAPCTNIYQKSDRTGVAVYPNPNKGVFEINLRQTTRIIITDLSGRHLYAEHLPQGEHEINLVESASGFYLLTAENESGRQTIKLVKE